MATATAEIDQQNDIQDNHGQVIKICELFVKQFVLIFESHLDAYNKRLKGELSKSGKWADFFNQCVGTAGTASEMLPDTIVSLIQKAVSSAGCKVSKSSAQKLTRYLNLLTNDPSQVRHDLVMSAIQVFQCYESQFVQVKVDGECGEAIEKLAEDAVNRVLSHLKTVDEELSTLCITRGVVQGKSTKYKHKSTGAPHLYSGHTLTIKNSTETWNTADLFTQPGLVTMNDNLTRYYTSKESKPKKFGYRLLFKWESGDKLAKHFKESKQEGEGYTYSLTEDDVQVLTGKVLNSSLGIRVSDELASKELEKEAGEYFKEVETFISENVDMLMRQINELFGKLIDTTTNTPVKSQVWFRCKRPLPSFVDREGKLEGIADGLKAKGIVVVCGLGGMGKTQLATKYAHDHCEVYTGNVMWIDASSLKAIKESFHELARDKLKLKLCYDDKDEKPLALVAREVYDLFSNSKSLFIFDAAENCSLIKDFLPINLSPMITKPHVLITSRFNSDWETEGSSKPILLEVFTDAEAQQFVVNELKTEDHLGVQELIKKLYNFPLALNHAVAYIKYSNKIHKEFTVKDYIVDYDKSKRSNSSTTKHRNTIFNTLAVALDKIENELSKKMFDLLTYLEAQKVPAKLFLKSLANNNQTKLTSATEELEKHSLAQLENGEFSIHKFVQEVRREMLVHEARRKGFVLKEALGMLKNKVKEFDQTAVYAPHALSLWNHAYTSDELVDLYIVKDIVDKKPQLNYFHLIAEGSSYEVFSVIMEKIERNFPDQFVNIIGANDGQGGTPLHNAASNADTRLLKLLIEKGAQVNAKTKHGWTPLLLAVKIGNLDHVKILIESKARIDDHTKYGHTSLHIAARNDYLNIVSVLLSNGADVNARCKNQFTPLHFATKMNNLQVVQLLLNQPGVDVNAATEFQLTPLVFAAKAGHLECVEALLQKGADVNACDAGDFTPLHSAAVNGHAEVVNALLRDGAIDVNLQTTKGNTALHLAAEKGHLEIVEALIARNAKVDVKNEDGNLPIDLARKEKKLNVENCLKMYH